MRIFLQDLVYLRLISKIPQFYRKSRLKWTPLQKILNRKIIINHFQNWIFDAKPTLQKGFFSKILNTKNSNLVIIYLTLKHCQHQNLVPQAFRG